MQILGIVFIVLGVIAFLVFSVAGSNFLSGFIILLPIVATGGILYTLGEIADDIRDINNILRNAFPDKLPEDPQESLEQKTCPVCGDEHDMDYPKCPKCNYKYE